MYMKLNNNLLNIKNTHSTSETDVYSANYVNEALDDKQDKGIVLWTNPNPTSSIGSTNITLSTDDYEYYEVYFKYYVTQDSLICEKSLKGFGTGCYIGDTYLNQNGGQSKRRRINRTDNTHFTIDDCKIQNGNTETVSNDFLIPYKIIGYK